MNDHELQFTIQPFTAIPKPLIELILVSGTNKDEKKILRQTCKLFRDVLDEALSRIHLKLHQKNDRQHIKGFLQRMQHMHSLRTVVLSSPVADGLLRYLPDHLTTLTILTTGDINLKGSKRFCHLTTLNIEVGVYGKVQGLQDISGLTSLSCDNSVGSVAHLTPTLTHLSIRDYRHLQGMDQLTNLEALEVLDWLPINFLQTHRNLPLKHLCLNISCNKGYVVDAAAWKSAPTTLTRVSLQWPHAVKPNVLPSTITHLQVIGAASGKVIRQAILSLPWLKSLDVSLNVNRRNEWGVAFSDLSKLTGLQHLGICVHNYLDENDVWHSDRVLSELSEVAKAVDKGVRLTVFQTAGELVGSFTKLLYCKPAWSTHSG